MFNKFSVQEIFPALAGTSDSDWQQVGKKKSREPFDPNAPSTGGAWARAAGTPTKPAPSAAAPEPSTTAATRQTDGPPSQERPNRSETAFLTALLRFCANPRSCLLFAFCCGAYEALWLSYKSYCSVTANSSLELLMQAACSKDSARHSTPPARLGKTVLGSILSV